MQRQSDNFYIHGYLPGIYRGSKLKKCVYKVKLASWNVL